MKKVKSGIVAKPEKFHKWPSNTITPQWAGLGKNTSAGMLPLVEVAGIVALPGISMHNYTIIQSVET